jgi:hypothetical protein
MPKPQEEVLRTVGLIAFDEPSALLTAVLLCSSLFETSQKHRSLPTFMRREQLDVIGTQHTVREV